MSEMGTAGGIYGLPSFGLCLFFTFIYHSEPGGSNVIVPFSRTFILLICSKRCMFPPSLSLCSCSYLLRNYCQGSSCSRFQVTILLSSTSQILSNEEKRANFDRYGDAGESQGYSQHQHRQFHHFHEGFYFDESFFHFPFNSERRDTSDEKYLLHFSHYINEIVPDSFKKPYLIKITSDWCFSCIHIEPVWKEVAQELEALGKDEAP